MSDRCLPASQRADSSYKRRNRSIRQAVAVPVVLPQCPWQLPDWPEACWRVWAKTTLLTAEADLRQASSATSNDRVRTSLLKELYPLLQRLHAVFQESITLMEQSYQYVYVHVVQSMSAHA